MTRAPRRIATDDATDLTSNLPQDAQNDQGAAPDTSTRAFVKLGGPLFIANLAVVGNGTIDTIMAGRLSATDLAAVAVGSSIYVSVYIGLMGVLQALSPIAGHHFGAQRCAPLATICSKRCGFHFSSRSRACRSCLQPAPGWALRG